MSAPSVSAPAVSGARRVARVSLAWPAVGLAAAFALRLWLTWQRATPNYFPDEYLYAALGRSLAALHGAQIRGHSTHFPALLQPLLTAPAWSIGGLAGGYRIVQALNAAAITAAAAPVYVVARRLGLARALCIAAAALTLVAPDALYASFVLAEPFAYVLVLAASAVAIAALARPTVRREIAFLLLSLLAVAARVQFVALPACYLVAAVGIGLRTHTIRSFVRDRLIVLLA